MTLWKCRLTLVGSVKMVTAFGDNTAWQSAFDARHVEWMQLSPRRHVCEFMTRLPPVTQLAAVSHQWMTLTFLLDYEDERRRVKGLAKGKAGEVEHHWIRY
jgi:hypothetical protein